MKLVATGLGDSRLSFLNPLRGLTLSRVVAELEAAQRGEMGNLQWLYHHIEKRDATLRGAKRRILSALGKLDWDIKIQAGLTGTDVSAAEKQRAMLKAEYERMNGFRAALKHLALAEFRGYAHLEKHYAQDGGIIKLQPVPQWHWCKQGCYGEWLFQEDALRGGIQGVPIDTRNFVIRAVEDPINEIALIAHTRKGLSSKDFDAFIARYGIPFVFWILSDSMAAALANEPAKMNEFMAIMRGIGSDGEGILPGGTLETLTTGGGGKDQNPFLQHLGYQDEQIVMAATSGKLTMLNEATGLGSGNAEAHQDTFDDLAQALALEISETFQEQFDAPVLARLFPGARPLVYFELAAKDAEDVGKLCANVKILSDAGLQADPAEISEKTGLKLLPKAAPPVPAAPAAPVAAPVPPAPAVSLNRDKTQDNQTQDARPDQEAQLRKAAAGLLSGFSDLATLFLSADEKDLEPLFTAAVLTGPPASSSSSQ